MPPPHQAEAKEAGAEEQQGRRLGNVTRSRSSYQGDLVDVEVCEVERIRGQMVRL